MMYWHLRPDDYLQYRMLENRGPAWAERAYYEENYVSRQYGPFDPKRLDLTFRPKPQKRSKPDFYYGGMPPSCSVQTFDLLETLLRQFVVTFPLRVDGEQWLSFRPSQFLDLIDMERSTFRRFSDGEPYDFQHIFLREPPLPSLPIFGFSHPGTALREIVVSNSFKELVEAHKLTGLLFLNAFPLE